MEQSSYYKIMEVDTEEHDSCPFKWDCENCYKSLYVRFAAVADFPSTTGHFTIIGFTNNKDKKDHIAKPVQPCLPGDQENLPRPLAVSRPISRTRIAYVTEREIASSVSLLLL